MSVQRAAGSGTVTAWTRQELMVITAARVLKDHDVVLVGIGLQNLACNLARRLHAPNLQLVYESGVFGAAPDRLPLSIGDPCLVSGAAAVCSLSELFLFYLQRGLIDVGFLGAGQIDRFGNLNTTVVGPYDAPRVRLPGSGGACDIALLARRVFVITPQSPRVFVDRVDFVTSPGFAGPHRPEGARGAGPELIVTDLGTYGFDPETGEMRIRTLHQGVTHHEVSAATGWPIPAPATIVTTPEPDAAELKILRGLDAASGQLSTRR
jgi:glutaconate CoA-transferase subunit B